MKTLEEVIKVQEHILNIAGLPEDDTTMTS